MRAPHHVASAAFGNQELQYFFSIAFRPSSRSQQHGEITIHQVRMTLEEGTVDDYRTWGPVVHAE